MEEQFGPYLVYERLGVGGMATVHRALEQGAEGFERIVALKRLLPHLAEDASFIKSFVREAKLASILNHVNIVQIYELGRVGTEYFISMEYIDGRDIRRILRHARKVTGPPPVHVTVGLMLQLCDALDYAHNKVDDEGHPMGLVHRDISPSNLIVTSGGHLKIIDFGIAKAQSSQLRTQTGRVKGKLAYMAPEAISGSRELDARSDIWATGVILHELLTARPLFASKNEYQTLLKVQKGDLHPPSTFNQGCPPELDAIVFRALARDPDERFSDATELRDELMHLKKQYSLATGFRDVAGWIDWAFGLELPTGFSGNSDPSIVMSVETPVPVHHKTPRPPRDRDEDEAVDSVWGVGAGDSGDHAGVVLDDVPDVSEKHVRPKRDTEDEQFNDIPTPLPSHGTMPSVYGDSAGAALAAVTDPLKARGSEQMRALTTQPTGPQPIAAPPRTPTSTAAPTTRPARTTYQGIASTTPTDRPPRPLTNVDTPSVSDRLAAQRERDSAAPENVPVTDSTANVRSQTGPHPSLSKTGPHPSLFSQTGPHQSLRKPPSQPPANMRVATIPPLNQPRRVATIPPLDQPLPKKSPTLPPTTRLSTNAATEEFSRPADPLADARANLDDSVPVPHRDTPDPDIARSAALTPPVAVPVVRFSSGNTLPPPLNLPLTAPTATPAEPVRVVQTRQGFAPVSASAAPHFEARRHKPASNIQIGATIAARAVKPKRTWLYVLAGLVLAAGTATAVAMMVTQSKDGSSKAATRIAPTRTTGTIKFVTEPVDAEIKIEGELVHTGSPYSSDLAAGTHQIEIHRDGYKSWLTSFELSAAENATLRVVLEPLTTNVDATLMITTTPAGLDVILDGQPLAQKTPIKTSLKVGAHTIAVRQDGVELWHQTIEAEPSSDYEINRSFTADKQRERATLPKAPSRQPTSSNSKDSPDVTDEKDPPETAGSAAPNALPGAVAAIAPPSPIAPTPSAGSASTSLVTVAKPSAPATTPPAPNAPTPAVAKAAPMTPTAPNVAKPAVPVPAKITATPAPATAAPSGPPPIVPPNAVRKIVGDPPNVEKFKNVQLPASLAAKVCIDETGKVGTVAMVSKLDRRIAEDLQDALKSWRYAPYKKNGAASAACFVVTFRAK